MSMVKCNQLARLKFAVAMDLEAIQTIARFLDEADSANPDHAKAIIEMDEQYGEKDFMDLADLILKKE